jgi:hypothetical protein
MGISPVTYGSFNLNDGINYFVTKKSYGFPSINPSMFKIGRLEGMKKVGENINERKLQIEMRILGTSRADLETKIDVLLDALFNRNQNLTMHTNDTRYFICDCVDFKCDLHPGQVISTTATLDFIAYIPFAFAPSPTFFDTGAITMPSVGAALGQTAYSSTYTLVSGGNVFTRPTLRITQQTPLCSMSMTGATLISGHIYTSITCAATPQSLNIGDDLILTSGTHIQSIVVSQFTPAGSTTVSVGGFAANFAYPAGASLTRDLTWGQIQINQATDQQVLVVSSSLPATFGDYLDINCDPTTTNGFTAILNGGNTLSAVAGSFPILEDGSTDWTITILSNSVPQVDFLWTWTPRWIS